MTPATECSGHRIGTWFNIGGHWAGARERGCWALFLVKRLLLCLAVMGALSGCASHPEPQGIAYVGSRRQPSEAVLSTPSAHVMHEGREVAVLAWEKDPTLTRALHDTAIIVGDQGAAAGKRLLLGQPRLRIEHSDGKVRTCNLVSTQKGKQEDPRLQLGDKIIFLSRLSLK